eukprot:Nk52_evm5s259 gene=Nk52_evmTU5s259
MTVGGDSWIVVGAGKSWLGSLQGSRLFGLIVGGSLALAMGVRFVYQWLFADTSESYKMQPLPASVKCYKVNPEWDQDSFPKGLRCAHNTKVGVWAELSILSGSLKFHFLDGKTGPKIASYAFSAGDKAIAPPQQYHKVEIVGPVKAILRFYRGD